MNNEIHTTRLLCVSLVLTSAVLFLPAGNTVEKMAGKEPTRLERKIKWIGALLLGVAVLWIGHTIWKAVRA
jgi:hypothetical protein